MVALTTYSFTVLCTVLLLATVLQWPDVWTDPKILFSMVLLSFTHFMLYPWIWYYPRHYQRYFAGSKGVEVYGGLVFIQKALFGLVATYWWFRIDSFISLFTHWPMLTFAASAALIIGFVLSKMVYQKIGADGVYYGCKLGKEIPWCYDFPFTTFRHPQYMGAFLIFMGFCILCCSWSNAGECIVLCVFQAYAYGMTGIMEEGSENESSKEASPAATPTKVEMATREMSTSEMKKVA